MKPLFPKRMTKPSTVRIDGSTKGRLVAAINNFLPAKLYLVTMYDAGNAIKIDNRALKKA